ncbi:hypothetical protein NF701_08780 [Sphingomonadaceae bacterium OTU29THOMA1]|nr:hypothetical protein NF701_08780 [Sphingomonadaceae bacterium OTU29THOMA1]
MVETAWIAVAAGLAAHKAASELYGGRGFGLAREAAAQASAELYVISAGLGLVHSARDIPSYGVTVSDRGDQAIARRVAGRFDPSSWWAAVSRTPYSESLQDVAARHRGLLLIALTAPYAAMIGSELGALQHEALARIRLFGHGIEAVLPRHLAGSVMPYDARLNAAVPGTRTDFAQRALRHFCQHVAIDGSLDTEQSAHAVQSLLAGHVAPTARVRPRRSDEEIVAIISEHLERTTGIGRILRLVRDSDGLACEQARFSRLYELASAQRARA